MLGQVVADERAHVGVLPVEERRQGRDVDDGLHVAAPLSSVAVDPTVAFSTASLVVMSHKVASRA